MLCFSCNITVPFPFSHFIPLIPLSLLDVGEAPAPASPPTLSLHYSLHTIILLPPTWRHGPPSFVSFYIRCFNMLPVCLFHHMSKSVAISHFYCWTLHKYIHAFFLYIFRGSKECFPPLLKAENPSLETDESRIGHAVHSKPKAAVSPPTHLLKAILKLHESGTACHFPLSLGGGGCIIMSKQPAHF